MVTDPSAMWTTRSWKNNTSTCSCQALWISCGRGIL